MSVMAVEPEAEMAEGASASRSRDPREVAVNGRTGLRGMDGLSRQLKKLGEGRDSEGDFESQSERREAVFGAAAAA